jgi:translation elongation factor EF-Tu-like GTPase
MEYARISIQLLASDMGRRTPFCPQGRKQKSFYMPHFRVGGVGEFLGVAFVDGPEQIAPGGSGECEVVLMYEGVDYSLLRPGASFDIVEGPKTIGSGVVLRRWKTEAAWNGVSSA